MLAGLAALAGLAFLSLAPFLSGDWRVQLLDHFRIQYAALGLGLLLVALLLGRRMLALAFAALALANAAIVVPDPVATARAALAAPDTPAAITVVSYNTLYLNKEFDPVTDYLRGSGADLVFLLEFAPPWRRVADALSDVYPYQYLTLGPLYGDGIGILSRFPLSGRMEVYPAGRGRPALIATAATPEGRITIAGVHPNPPMSIATSQLNQAYFRALGALLAEREGPVVVAGDFNATPWSWAMRDFVATAALERFGRPVPTFPAWLGPLGIPIDHVLAGGGARVLSLAAGPPHGSDHRPVVARVALP
jgi:endonuclease/exonuclease/phosphatase (EEP) superfamily protein YafD